MPSPGGVVVLVCLPVVGWLTTKVDARWLIAVGVVISSVSLFHMANFSLDIDYRTAVLARCLQSVGMAFLFVPINAAAFAYISKRETNRATGIINLARNIGGSFGISMVTTLLARRSQFHQNVLVGHATPLDFGYRNMLENASRMLALQGSDLAQAQSQAQGLLYGLLQKHAAMLAFADDFWLMAISFLVLLPVIFMMKKIKPRKGAAPAH